MQFRSATAFIFAACLLASGALATPAAAGSIIADGPSGSSPSPFDPTLVSARAFQGPNADSIVLGPQSIILDSVNAFSHDFTSLMVLPITGARYTFSALSASIAGRNPDGTIGPFYDPGLIVSQLATQLFVSNINAPEGEAWSFLRISGLHYDFASGLGTPGAAISLSGSLLDQFNTTLTYETFASTDVVVSTVPTPGALSLGGLGLFALAAMRRKGDRFKA